MPSTLEIARDLLEQAEAVREARPDVARRIEEAAQALVDQTPPLSVAEVAALLGKSRPTVHAWVRAGILGAEEAAARGLRISPQSIMRILPTLLTWREIRRPGRLLPALRRWLDKEAAFEASLAAGAEARRAFYRERNRARRLARQGAPTA